MISMTLTLRLHFVPFATVVDCVGALVKISTKAEPKYRTLKIKIENFNMSLKRDHHYN